MIRKSSIAWIVCSLAFHCLLGQTVESKMYQWGDSTLEDTQWGSKFVALDGETRDFNRIRVVGYTLDKGQKISEGLISDAEQLLLVVGGKAKVSVKNTAKSMTSGSAGLFMPEEEWSIENQQREPVTFYVISYWSKADVNISRGIENGSSQLFAWDDLTFRPHDKGGVRKYFDQPTSMSSRFEMHTTTLNPGLKSHDPHTHRAAEIIMMIEGDTEEQIGEAFYRGSVGAFYFLESEVPHAIENVGDKPATYFAFQFE